MKKIKLRTVFSLLITLAFLFYIYRNRAFLLHSLGGIKPGYFIIVILGQIVVQLSNSLILRSSLRPLGVRLHRLEAIKLTSVSSFVNFFTPVVGGASTKTV